MLELQTHITMLGFHMDAEGVHSDPCVLYPLVHDPAPCTVYLELELDELVCGCSDLRLQNFLRSPLCPISVPKPHLHTAP